MKILMITPHVPYPPNSGARIRQWEQLQFLRRRHEVTLVSFAFSREERDQSLALQNLCSRFVLVDHPEQLTPADLKVGAGSPWPLQWYGTAGMTEALAELEPKGYHVVLLENIFMAHYHQVLPEHRTVLQEYNIESQVYKRYAQLRGTAEQSEEGNKDNRFWNATWMMMQAYEDRMWPAFPLRTTVSQQDKMEIDRRCKAGRTIVVENGVNTRTITPVNTTGSKTILFMGTLDYFPNRDAAVYCARTIMPLVWDLDPSIELCIAGRNPNEALMELGSDSRISVLANPPDMRDVASHCALTVVPLRVGGGTRLKILDSLALGLPVVSTSVGCEGLEVTDGEEVLIRDEPARIAEAIVNLVSDSRLWETLRLRGRRLVELRYDWQTIFGGLESELVCLSGEHDQPAAVALPECGEERSSTPESTSSSQPD